MMTRDTARSAVSTLLGPAILAGLTAATPAIAQTTGAGVDQRSFYVTGNAGLSFMTESEFLDSGPGVGRVGFTSGTDFAINAAAGYVFRRGLRAEAEVGYRAFGLEEVEQDTTGSTLSADGEISLFNFMGNLIADFGKAEFRPYVGVGLGLGLLDRKDVSFGTTEFGDADDLTFAYQFIGGVSYLLSPRTAFTVDYRFLGVTQNTLIDSTGIEVDGDGFGSHNVMVGVRYHF